MPRKKKRWGESLISTGAALPAVEAPSSLEFSTTAQLCKYGLPSLPSTRR